MLQGPHVDPQPGVLDEHGGRDDARGVREVLAEPIAGRGDGVHRERSPFALVEHLQLHVVLAIEPAHAPDEDRVHAERVRQIRGTPVVGAAGELGVGHDLQRGRRELLREDRRSGFRVHVGRGEPGDGERDGRCGGRDCEYEGGGDEHGGLRRRCPDWRGGAGRRGPSR